MKIQGPLSGAQFIDRPNRFLTIVQVDGNKVESHLPDPGRLNELLLPDVELKIRHVPNGRTAQRKTEWTTIMVKTKNEWVSIDSTLPNRFVNYLLKTNQLPFFEGYTLKKTEIKSGSHRFDFLLEKNSYPFYLEVKSVTLVEDGVAMFPDAVTERGTRHMKALAELVKSGNDAGVLFVCQRSDVNSFSPQCERDPKFAESLKSAEKAGVRIHVIKAKVTPESIQYMGEIPYNLN